MTDVGAKSRTLGVLAFALAVLLYLGTMIFGALAIASVVFFAALAVGIIAAISRRGRGWAIAAIAIAAFYPGSPLHMVLTQIFLLVFSLIFGPPEAQF